MQKYIDKIYKPAVLQTVLNLFLYIFFFVDVNTNKGILFSFLLFISLNVYLFFILNENKYKDIFFQLSSHTLVLFCIALSASNWSDKFLYLISISFLFYLLINCCSLENNYFYGHILKGFIVTLFIWSFDTNTFTELWHLGSYFKRIYSNFFY